AHHRTGINFLVFLPHLFYSIDISLVSDPAPCPTQVPLLTSAVPFLSLQATPRSRFAYSSRTVGSQESEQNLTVQTRDPQAHLATCLAVPQFSLCCPRLNSEQVPCESSLNFLVPCTVGSAILSTSSLVSDHRLSLLPPPQVLC